MKQTTLFDYFPKTVKVKVENQDYERNYKVHRITSTQVLKQYKPLIKSLVQQDLKEVIIEKENFENLSNLLGDNWFYDEASFGYTDKNHIMSVSTISQLNSSFFKLYNIADFILIDKHQIQLMNLLNEEYTKIKNVEYNTIYFKKAIEILKKSYQIYQHIKLKLIFLTNTKFAVLICPKF